jgi:hypothetical protein
LGARGSRSGKHLLYTVSEEAKNVSVYYYAAELWEENPKIVEAETLKAFCQLLLNLKPIKVGLRCGR